MTRGSAAGRGAAVARRGPRFLARVLLCGLVACAPVVAPRAPVVAAGPHAGASLEGARLVAIESNAELYGPLALTTVRLVFENAPEPLASSPPEATHHSTSAATRPPTASAPRVAAPAPAENAFEFALPNGASVARLAVRAGGAWAEAAFVPLVDVAFSDASAPASANTLRTRLPRANGRQEIVVAYTETLLGDYRLPLVGYPVLDRLDASIMRDGRPVSATHAQREAPAHDLRIPLGATSVRGGDYAIVRVAEHPVAPNESLADAALLVDSSGSMRASYADTVERTAHVFQGAAMQPKLIAAFDQEVVGMPSISAAAARRPAGATNLGAALGWAIAHGAKRAIVVTDGVATAGEHTADGLGRVDVLATGTDVGALHHLAALGTQPGAIVDISDANALAALGSPVGVIARVDVPGAVHAYPTELSRMGALASEALAFVELPAAQPLTLAQDDRAAVPLAPVSAPAWLVARAVAEARIRDLDRDRSKNSAEISALALQHHILTPLTALHAAGASAAATTFDADRDADDIPDASDRCPTEPETKNHLDDDDGCPDSGLVVIDSNYDYWFQAIHFQTGVSRIEPAVTSLLDQYGTMLVHHHEYELLALYGYTSAGEPAALGVARANAVRDALIARGVEPARLITKDFGATRPGDAGTSFEAQAKNRRVEVHVLMEHDRGVGGADAPDVPGVLWRGKALPNRSPYSPELGTIMDKLVQNDAAGAERAANGWLDRDPTERRAWIGLGDALRRGKSPAAERAYGSLLEFARPYGPRQDDDRVGAGFYLESVGSFALAAEAYARALRDTPNKPRLMRLHAWALARRPDKVNLRAAFEEILLAKRTEGAPAILARDVGLIAALDARDRPPDERTAILARARAAGGIGMTEASAFAVLTWASDSDLDLVAVGANDEDRIGAESDDSDDSDNGVEILVLDPKHPHLEAHEINPSAWEANRFTIGKMTIFRHDGGGHVEIDDHPFVIENLRSRVTFGATF